MTGACHWPESGLPAAGSVKCGAWKQNVCAAATSQEIVAAVKAMWHTVHPLTDISHYKSTGLSLQNLTLFCAHPDMIVRYETRSGW